MGFGRNVPSATYQPSFLPFARNLNFTNSTSLSAPKQTDPELARTEAILINPVFKLLYERKVVLAHLELQNRIASAHHQKSLSLSPASRTKHPETL